jgi:lipopolysaccharide/colanic/teichoic acid biosynthesis glycosyltransferase
VPVHTPIRPFSLDELRNEEIKKHGPRGSALKPGARRRPKKQATVSVREPIRPLGYAWYGPCKAVLDFSLALLLLIVLAPVILLTALLVRATSRGPAFYTQTRVGRDGRLFTIFKIRTMIDNCESLTGPRWSIPGDPRVTPIGQFLRRTHLDELPQLFNVIRGDMSLIGPRPERPEFTAKLERALPAYPERLRIRPGVTGLAQIHLPGDTSLASVRMKLAYDLFYIQQLSPGLEARILFCTVLRVLGVSFESIRRLSGISSEKVVERAVQIVLDGGPARRWSRSA